MQVSTTGVLLWQQLLATSHPGGPAIMQSHQALIFEGSPSSGANPVTILEIITPALVSTRHVQSSTSGTTTSIHSCCITSSQTEFHQLQPCPGDYCLLTSWSASWPQTVNLAFFVLPNAWILSSNCAWFDGVVTWSATVRWQVCLPIPYLCHPPPFPIWCMFVDAQ